MNIPKLGAAVPQRGNIISRATGKVLMKAMGGWDFEGTLPNLPKFVIIGAPHTSNWDFLLAMAAVFAAGFRFHWIGKHTIFRWPFGPFMRWLGGIPVDRNASQGVVEQVVDEYQRRDRFVVGIAPEGTRKKVERWKTGFYRIACDAGVPIVLAYLDYARKIIGFGPIFEPTGNLEADLAHLRAFFNTFKGKKPEQF